MKKNGLILSGGGARAAYQVGVLIALEEILPPGTHNPFPIICGTSAGALNALALATHSGSFFEAANELRDLWKDLETDNVYKTEWKDIFLGGFRLFLSLFNQGVASGKSIALLDNSPLRELLASKIDFSQLETGINNGDLDAICITAMNYTTGESVNFFQGREDLGEWDRHRRIGRREQLTLDHLMASSAIPGIFPSVRLGKDYYADGALRQVSPVSPALHMGADKIFVIGVSGNRNPEHWGRRKQITRFSPSIGQLFGHLFSSAFIDSLEGDLEQLERINHLLHAIPEEALEEHGIRLRPVDTMVISPTRHLDQIAGRNIRYMPKSMRFFLRSTGSTASRGGATTSSYLMFEKPFIDELQELGYHDTMWARDSIEEFFEV